ncbi:MAG: sugar kinase [Gaiellaceae bacterium]
MTELLTLGETMALFSAPTVGPLRHATTMLLGAAGAESNVAIGVRRLGHSAAWIGRVGDDELGRLVLARLRGEDLDVSGAVVDPTAQTGLMVKEQRTADVARVYYYRRDSAGSRIAPGDVDAERVAAARVLHVTGITPALSASARDAVEHAVEIARNSGTLVSLDYNYRSALWTADEAREVLHNMTARADLVFAGEDEAELVVGTADGDAAARALAALGPSHAVVKRAAAGAVAIADGTVLHAPAVPVRAVDAVGAGDAFVAGYLAALLDGAPPPDCLRTACAAGAFAVTVAGDWEGLPTRAELALLERSAGTVVR